MNLKKLKITHQKKYNLLKEKLYSELAGKSNLEIQKSEDDCIFFNLTTSKHWKSLPVGIIRVERELAKYLNTTLKQKVKFVCWDKDKQKFTLLSDDEVQEILDDEWCDPSFAGKHYSEGININEIIKQNDFLVSIGLDWDLSPINELSKLTKNTKCRLISACHDVIPIKYPEFTAREDITQKFKLHFVDMAHCAYKIFANSENSKSDLLSFYSNAELETNLPNIEVVSLAGGQPHQILPDLNDLDIDRLRHIKAMGDYVLYVSHFESRKNHRFLINVWKELYSRHGDNCPQLVLVGRKGWGVDSTVDQLRRSHAYRNGRIYWFDDVKDNFLKHLYRNSNFTVFPSFCEGWGLAATESMSFGKVCVVSNALALKEATQNLMPVYHPQDFYGWLEEIEKISFKPDYKAKLESNIADNYRHKTWSDFSSDFIQKLLR